MIGFGSQPTTAEMQARERITQALRDAARSRQVIEKDWVLSIAQIEGRQWLGWDDAGNRAISLIDPKRKHKYITHNLLRPLCEKWIGLVTMTRPDASAGPDTTSELDRAAAREGNALLGNLDRENAEQLATIQRAYWLFVCGVAWTKQYWNPGKMAEIPRYGPDGQIMGKQAYPAGGLCEEVLPPWEIYVDPWAKAWEQARYVIHATLRHRDWFAERFGKRGEMVEPDSALMAEGYVDGWLTPTARSLSLGGIWSGGADGSWTDSRQAKEWAVCAEMWEKPGPSNGQRGRLIILGGKSILYDGPRPDIPEGGRIITDRNPFPIVRMVPREAASHPYGRGWIPDLAPLQIGYNRLLTRLWGRVEEDKLTVAIEKGSKVGADAYIDDEDSAVRKVYFNDTPPVFQQVPGVIPDVHRLREITWNDMQHITGIHDVQMGNTPPGAGSGIAIELLQQGDRTQMGLTLQAIEQNAADRGENRLTAYAINASGDLPILLGADRSRNAESAQRQAMAFVALTGGGGCSMIVTPGSATPKSPRARTRKSSITTVRGCSVRREIRRRRNWLFP